MDHFKKDGVGWRKGSLPKLEKGPDILIKALIEIKKEHKDIHVLLTGPSRGYVINELIRHNIDYTYSKFINFNKINSYYNVLDLYLVTSREEGGAARNFRVYGHWYTNYFNQSRSSNRYY